MVLRGVLHNPLILYKFFANLYLARTIIFGGDPVVTPLLREYIVAEGRLAKQEEGGWLVLDKSVVHYHGFRCFQGWQWSGPRHVDYPVENSLIFPIRFKI